MRERFLSSGRVRYLPLREYEEERGCIRTLLSGKREAVEVCRKVIDTTYFSTTVPSTHVPAYEIDTGVRLLAPNELPRIGSVHRNFTIVGGGKTAMDTGAWLLEHGAEPDQIRWIVPRDSWLINRAMTQPGDGFFYDNLGGYAAILEAAAQGRSVKDIFARLEASKYMLRIDTTVEPTMFRNAVISKGEVELLRRIRDVVRMGRVIRIGAVSIELEQGSVGAEPDSLYIDCTAKAFAAGETEDVFTDGRIYPQMIINGNICMSAATIAYVEANYWDDATKNRLCTPIPLMNRVEDWVPLTYWHLESTRRRSAEADLGKWMRANRLTGFGSPKGTKADPDSEYTEIMSRVRGAMPLASENLKHLMASV